ncbi:MAG: indolepyruvate oxidoreductase subunit beta [bacterium]|nr:indolepyruvate oxidoreductase subunit beta [bacterium]
MNQQILLCGVGGQGILFATKILSEVAVRKGQGVIGSETHGMSQRGGSVTSHLKIGSFRGPLIRRGGADYLFCFEKGEIFGNLAYLKDGGVAFIDAPNLDYIPEKIKSILAEKNIVLHSFDASATAMQMGAPLVLNLILIGFAGRFRDFPLETEALRQVVGEVSPERFRGLNLQAFDFGLGNKSVSAAQ